MTWDGKAIAGTVNPGPEAMTLGRVTVDYAKWAVRIDADGKDSSGKPVRVLADGKITLSARGIARSVEPGRRRARRAPSSSHEIERKGHNQLRPGSHRGCAAAISAKQ